jgi:sulfur carrier protein
VRIVVNGTPCDVDAPATVADVLLKFQLVDRPVAVELNRELVPRAAHASRTVAPEDRLEIVTLVGGG